MLGANKDLEIDGEPFYCVVKIIGKFLDIFPVWKKYFSPNSTQEETVKKWKEEVILSIHGKRYKYLLTNENNFWQIYGIPL